MSRMGFQLKVITSLGPGEEIVENHDSLHWPDYRHCIEHMTNSLPDKQQRKYAIVNSRKISLGNNATLTKQINEIGNWIKSIKVKNYSRTFSLYLWNSVNVRNNLL